MMESSIGPRHPLNFQIRAYPFALNSMDILSMSIFLLRIPLPSLLHPVSYFTVEEF